MNYASVQETQVSLLTNTRLTMTPKTPVMKQPSRFSSPIGKIINFRKKSPAPNLNSVSPSVPRKMAQLADAYIFGSVERIPYNGVNAQSEFPQRVSSIPRPVFQASPKRPPPPRPQRPSNSSSGRNSKTANKKRYTNEECCLCFEKIAASFQDEKNITLQCDHVVHESCLLLFIESNLESRESFGHEGFTDQLYPQCLKCGDRYCVPLDDSSQDEIISKLVLHARGALELAPQPPAQQAASRPRALPNTIQSPHSLVPRFPLSARNKSQVNSPKLITRKVKSTTPTLVSSRIRTSAIQTKLVLDKEGEEKEDEKREEDKEDDEEGDDDGLEDLEIIHIDDLRGPPVSSLTSTLDNAIREFLDEYPLAGGPSVINQLGKLLFTGFFHVLFKSSHTEQDCRVYLLERKLLIQPLTQDDVMIKQEYFEYNVFEEISKQKTRAISILHQTNTSVELRMQECLEEMVLSGQCVRELANSIRDPEYLLTELLRKNYQPLNLILLLQLDSTRKIKFSENINLINTLRALSLISRLFIRVIVIDESNKILAYGEIQSVLEQLSSVNFEQIRGCVLNNDWWDTYVVQQWFHHEREEINICLVSNSDVSDTTTTTTTNCSNTNNNCLLQDYYCTNDLQKIVKIHIGFLQNDIPNIIDIQSFMELMDFIMVYYSFDIGQDIA